MLPLFNEGRRQINLGGARTISSSETILNQAKARRTERLETKRRQDNAIRIQAWWRGNKAARDAREQMRSAFYQDPNSIRGLRCLVLIGQDEELLGHWSTTIVSQGEGELFQLASGAERGSWLVLIRQVALSLLTSVSNSPTTPNASAHLKVLSLLLSPSNATTSLLQIRTESSGEVLRYLQRRHYYGLLAKSITSVGVESRSSPSLLSIIPLIVYPLVAFVTTAPDLYLQAFQQLISCILTIPLLLHRIPIPSISYLSINIPFSSLDVIQPCIPTIASSASLDAKVHLIANLTAFIPPSRYQILSPTSLDTYLQLLTTIMNTLPVHALNPAAALVPKEPDNAWVDEDDSDSETNTRVSVVTTFQENPKDRLPQLDARTQKRLKSIPDTHNLSALISAARRQPHDRINLCAFFLSLNAVWPSTREQTLTTVVMHTGGGLVRELYRLHVRTSPLGKEEDVDTLMSPDNGSYLLPIIFLTDLYTQVLLTMGDDEFFTTSPANSSAPRNPLSLDELISFSRQLLNIAFNLYLYWKEDGTKHKSIAGMNLSWESVRDRVTKCLQAIHARDSRKPFVPAGHWLLSSQIDMQSFIEAAIYEELELSQPTERPLSKRQISHLSPRLGVLNNIPFAIPFETRVSIFRHFIANDMINKGGGPGRQYSYMSGRRTRIKVRRGNVAQDGFDKLADADLKMPVEITFVDSFGQDEAGIDGGGVFKEFFTSLCKEVFDTDRGLWLANKRNELYPNPHAYATESHSLSWYRFIGRVLGKALYEGILVDVAFAGFFLAKWLGKQSFLDDLASLDPDLYQGLIFLKHYGGNPEDLSLNFTVAIDEFGVPKSFDLIANGSNIAVTRENRLQYIYLVSHFRLSRQIKLQSEAFFEGLSEMIDPKWLRMFNQQEVQILLGGVNSPIDLDDLRSNTQYGGVYDDDEHTVRAFWDVVNDFDHEQRRALLRFVTSCSRPPLLGFKELRPNFSIRDAGNDEHRLPTSSTCVNLLKLPRYKSPSILRAKLMQAITSNAGFDLS